MTAERALARLAIASLVVGAAACRRKTPEVAPLPESFARFELSAGAGAKDAGVSASDAGPRRPDVFIQRVVRRDLSALMEAARAHPAVASLEAAGCDLALVMTGEAYDRFVELGDGMKMPKRIDDPASPVIYCASRTTFAPPPDCAALAPIFARVARPKRRFHVLSGFGFPPSSPRCSGVHDAKGKTISGEGPGYGAR